MYLKSLNINGFKSFYEKTTVDFSNKVNVIVGPNGSGKSNVVDAISWVLGTQSPATLRTNKMEDVIFAGTEKLSKKGFAEVYLNFEVDEKLFNGNSEISIGRKLFRDGTSEYFMNGLNCRLLDIQEFLNDVGIGKQQHIIISQGQIAEILNSKPEDHRTTIEEAAGILPLRVKKEKSLKRIESGEKEIKRAKDVLREIKKQLKPLQDQAEKARIHEESTKLLKSKVIELNVMMFRKFDDKYKSFVIEENSLVQNLADIDKKLKTLKDQKGQINNELGDGYSIGSTFKDYSGKFINLSEQLRSLAQVANERKDNLEREEIKASEELNKTINKINENNNQISMLTSQLMDKKQSLTNLENQNEDIKYQIEEIIKKLSASTEVNEAVLESEIKQIRQSIDITNKDLQLFETEFSKWEEDLQISESLLNDLNIKLKSYQIPKDVVEEFPAYTKKIIKRELNINKNNIIKINSDSENLNSELLKKEELLSNIFHKEEFKSDINKQKDELENKLKQLEQDINLISNQLITSQERIKNLSNQNTELNIVKKNLEGIDKLHQKSQLSEIINSAKTFIEFANSTSNKLEIESEKFDQKYGNSNKKIERIDEQIENLNNELFNTKDNLTNVAIKKSETDSSKGNHYSNLVNIYGLNIDEINQYGIIAANQSELENEIKLLENKLEEIGTVNYLAKEDFDSLNLRYEEIQSTIDDLQLSKKELLLNIKEVETEIEFRIESSFNSISVHFSEIFETLFPGGKGSLSFTNKTNILETGIEISVQPRGKKVKKLSLLSGGERSLAAIAFLFSIFKSFPSPFYILDEVEAALDDANLHRMINLLDKIKEDAQYIIVTHQQQTMHAGDVLYGVTMEPGSGSRVFTKTKEDFESLIGTNEK